MRIFLTKYTTFHGLQFGPLSFNQHLYIVFFVSETNKTWKMVTIVDSDVTILGWKHSLTTYYINNDILTSQSSAEHKYIVVF
jgi:hypothetical protein